jgi:ABC-2 type transport system ATP-binding protein
MAQPAKLYDDLTVAENIHFYAELYHVPRDEYRQRMARLLQFSGLGPFTNRLFRNLSGGMKQKVGLTCALIHRPRVLFLDEPTNGVDPVSRREFWKILYELKREHVSIVVASTYLDEVERCHRVALFDHGRVRLVMEPPALKRLMKGYLFNLTLGDRPRALKLLKTLPHVANPSLFGAGIHFTLKSEDVLPGVEKALGEAGVGSWNVEVIQPSLEDVYLALLAEED